MPAVVSYGFYAGIVGLEKSMPKIIDSKIFRQIMAMALKLEKASKCFTKIQMLREEQAEQFSAIKVD